jgi:amino acid efflux transporter
MTEDAGHLAPLVTVADRLFGAPGRIGSGVLAAVICLGTMNAYMAGLSRLGYTMARDGDLPGFLGRLDARNGTPKNSIVFQFALNVAALLIQFAFDLPLRNFFLIPNLSFLILYTLGCTSAARLLRGRPVAVASAYFSSAICAMMMPFASGVLLVPAIIGGCALLFRLGFKRT